MSGQRKWQRASLLAVLGYEGAGALVGGSLLVAKPDGGYMDIPVNVMHGAFASFLIPGMILFALGALNVAAFLAVWRRNVADWIAAGLALGGLAVWFFVEIVILRELHWLHAMWGLPVLWGIGVAIPLIPIDRRTLRDVWLGCGVISSLLYAAMNVVVPMQWPGYNQASRVVSELSAIGAPTRPVWVALGMIYTMLVIAFGWGIRMAAADDRRLDVVGILISIYGALGFVWPFAPMHLRETLAAGGGTFSDTMHIILGASTEVIYLVALVLAATALGTAFRVYSIATAVALAAFGVLTFREAPRLGMNQLTPLIGVWERINIGLFLLWMVVLAVAIWRRTARSHVDRSRVIPTLEGERSSAQSSWRGPIEISSPMAARRSARSRCCTFNRPRTSAGSVPPTFARRSSAHAGSDWWIGEFARLLIDLGRGDARANHDRIVRFFETALTSPLEQRRPLSGAR